MSGPPTPSGYDVAKTVKAGRYDCLITVGFDQVSGHIPRFLVRLHYLVDTAPVQWEAIARFDHNETASDGHDVYQEGLHIDVTDPSGVDVTVHPRHGPLPPNRGAVIRACVDYFRQHAQYFVDVYEGNTASGSPPPWPDGGQQRPPRLMPHGTLGESMSRERTSEEPLSTEELTELLADATGTDAEEIDRQAQAFEIGPPEEAEVVEPE